MWQFAIKVTDRLISVWAITKNLTIVIKTKWDINITIEKKQWKWGIKKLIELKIKSIYPIEREYPTVGKTHRREIKLTLFKITKTIK